MTYSVKGSDIERRWHVLDASEKRRWAGWPPRRLDCYRARVSPCTRSTWTTATS